MGSGRAGLRRATMVFAVFAAFAFGASAASAATVTTDCANLSSTLSGAAGTNGETIVLSDSGLCNAHFTLPSTATNLTIAGASTGTNGFDGTGLTNTALSGSNMDGLTLRNLTFQNYSYQGPAVFITSVGGALPTIDSDRFRNNSHTGGAGFMGALTIGANQGTCSDYTSPLTITNSTFSGNTSTTTSSIGFAAGGAVSVGFSCSATTTANLVITGNTFTGNSVSTAGAAGYGGALYSASGFTGQLTAQQSGNVFQNNSIVSTAATPSSTYNGGGEWLGSINLTSTGDEFIGNSLPGPSGATAASEGAGLGVIRGNDCTPPTDRVSATAINLAAVGNTIGAPSLGGSVEGAGVYAGCEALQGTGGFDLTLIDSTVSGNSGPGGAAGVDGEATDTLALQNSIVNGDTGAGSSEIGGFGGGITASYSDVCNGTAPLTGTGNICADPKLANAAAGDVHETSTSPTIDAGSNALVPSGVTTDFYGKQREVGTKQSAAIVDIGAAEDQTAFSPAPPPPSGPGTAGISGEKAIPGGFKVTISCAGAATQSCSGNVIATTTETLKGSTVIAIAASARRHKRVVTVARAHYKLTGGHRVTLKVKVNRKGRALLKRFGKLPVIVKITQLNAAGKQAVISHHKLTIKPRHKKHK
jgi:hypothetical protein